MYEYACKIVRVIDGDTTDVDIDLGFGESRTRDAIEKIYGNAAKSLVMSYLPVGSSQILITHKDEVGKYGRILGKFKCYDSKTDAWIILNNLMIQQHHAVAYHGQSKEDIEEQHLANRELVDLVK